MSKMHVYAANSTDKREVKMWIRRVAIEIGRLYMLIKHHTRALDTLEFYRSLLPGDAELIASQAR